MNNKQKKEIYSAGVLDGMIRAQKAAKNSSFSLIGKLKFDYVKEITNKHYENKRNI